MSLRSTPCRHNSLPKFGAPQQKSPCPVRRGNAIFLKWIFLTSIFESGLTAAKLGHNFVFFREIRLFQEEMGAHIRGPIFSIFAELRKGEMGFFWLFLHQEVFPSILVSSVAGVRCSAVRVSHCRNPGATAVLYDEEAFVTYLMPFSISLSTCLTVRERQA